MELSIDDVRKIISDAKVAAADPVSVAMQVFSGLGDKATVSGGTLREALSASVIPVGGPLADVLSAIQKVTKAGGLVTLTNAQEVQTVLNGTQVRLKNEVSFDVAEQDGLPTLNNIAGVSVHKVFWFSIQSIQLKENQGQQVVQVVTSGGTKEFPVG
jgi:hypothetical protein